jgi:hypothetical protein
MPGEPLSDVDFDDQLKSLLRKARAVAELAKTLSPEELLSNKAEVTLYKAMELCTDQVDVALAELERWFDSRHPPAPRWGAVRLAQHHP